MWLPLLAAAQVFLAQATGHVYVHVADSKTGKAFAGMTVQVTTREGDVQQSTNGGGDAVFLSVSTGIARVDILREGHLAACPIVIDVSPDESDVVNVHMRDSQEHAMKCNPSQTQLHVRPGVTSDVYDIF
jgi:hypothetical protein